MAWTIGTTADQADLTARRQASLLEARAEALRRAGPDFVGIEDDIANVLRPDQLVEWHKLYKKFLTEWVPERPPGLSEEGERHLKAMGYIRNGRYGTSAFSALLSATPQGAAASCTAYWK